MVLSRFSWTSRSCIVSALILGSSVAQAASASPLNHIHPLIGTVNGGHVFPGASLPFSMAKAVADCTGENQAGFASDGSTITGFSHMHDSGTGGGSSLGNFPLFPQAGCPDDDLANCNFSKSARATDRKLKSAKATPGYFSLELATEIRAEMTVTNHTALYRFTFPETPTEPNASLKPLILADLTDLSDVGRDGVLDVDQNTGRMAGSATFNPSFGLGSYRLHFCADFSGADVSQVGYFNGNTPTQKDFTAGKRAAPSGAYVQFAPKTQILARVGVSFISADQACSNAENEIPGFDFEEVHQAARTAWKEKLSPIQIDSTGVDNKLLTTFWSGVYRSMLSPQDYTGENPLWTSQEPYYDSYYCIWDSFRSIHPFISLVDPLSQTLMIRSLIDIYRHEGYLPDCRMSLCKGYTQGGSNADIVLADAYLKGFSDGIDWDTGYRAVKKDAEKEPQNFDIEGRGGLANWKSIGYIPLDETDVGTGLQTRSVSRTVEYAYDDFCIAEMAKGLGHPKDYAKYMKRSTNWRNVYKANQTSSINGQDTGFVGFLQPRNSDGTWGYQDPIFCSPLLNFDSCYLNADGHETYEGSSWLYTFFVPQNMAGLIETLGGKDTFVKRLDYLHDSGILYVGDEQAFINVFLYHYAGRPALSAERSHFYIPNSFNSTISGIPGNDDSGAMGSFSSLTMMGIFPNPGQNVYFITPPFFPSVSITNNLTGKKATIKNINFDAAYKNIYIQSAKLNGQPYTKNWIDHSFFTDGGTLELTLGSKESSWGTDMAKDVPPSADEV